MFDHKRWIATFLRSPGQNDAQALGVRVVQADGAAYRCIGVHHLSGAENVGKHNVYLDVLDEQGKRMPSAKVGWTWVGKRNDEAAPDVAMDKPDAEPGGNIAVHAGQTVSVWVAGAVSDSVVNITSSPNLPDTDGNYRYHHSYYVVWQRGAVVTPPPPPPTDEIPTGDEAALRQRIADLEAVIAAIVPVLESGKARMAEAMQVTIDGVRAAIGK